MSKGFARCYNIDTDVKYNYMGYQNLDTIDFITLYNLLPLVLLRKININNNNNNKMIIIIKKYKSMLTNLWVVVIYGQKIITTNCLSYPNTEK